jgi:predicted DNA-binding protein YlxM (UPF0122 family)
VWRPREEKRGTLASKTELSGWQKERLYRLDVSLKEMKEEMKISKKAMQAQVGSHTFCVIVKKEEIRPCWRPV